jgi:hypothetical protein
VSLVGWGDSERVVGVCSPGLGAPRKGLHGASPQHAVHRAFSVRGDSKEDSSQGKMGVVF